MELEDLSADLRPRERWHAIDLGFEMAREHYLQLLATSVILVLPIACGLALLFPDWATWILVAVWWAKPLWERVHLFVLSRSLFGDRPSIRATLRALPGYAKPEILTWLSFRRFSPTRSFDLPVVMLEGPHGPERARRITLLHRGPISGGAFWLTILCIHVESFLMLGLILLAQFLVPDTVDIDLMGSIFDDTGDGGAIAAGLSFVAGLMAYLIVAPFYVASGFSLYLHRRTILEGWDLELAFRQIAERARKRRGRSGFRAALPLLLFLGLTMATLGLPNRSQAEALTPEAAHESIEAILLGDEFHEVQTITLPRFVLDWQVDADEDEEDEAGSFSLPEWALSLINVFANSLEAVIVAIALAITAWVIYRIARERKSFSGLGLERMATRRRSAPVELFGLDVRDESLPDDLAAEARKLALAGDIRAALALLYRGALSRMVSVYGAEFSDSVTEGECVEAARPLIPADAGEYFHDLTSIWLRCAYGHREPAADRVAGLCESWNVFFVAEPVESPGEDDADER